MNVYQEYYKQERMAFWKYTLNRNTNRFTAIISLCLHLPLYRGFLCLLVQTISLKMKIKNATFFILDKVECPLDFADKIPRMLSIMTDT